MCQEEGARPPPVAVRRLAPVAGAKRGPWDLSEGWLRRAPRQGAARRPLPGAALCGTVRRRPVRTAMECKGTLGDGASAGGEFSSRQRMP